MRRFCTLPYLAFLLVVLLGTAACGADATATTGGSPAAPPPAPPAAPPATPPAGSGPDSTTGAPLNYGMTNPLTYQSTLTAGQVDDNIRFDDYLSYIHAYQGLQVLPIPVDQRMFIRVVDGAQQPVAGARVRLFDGPQPQGQFSDADQPVFEGRTMSDGRVLYFPQAVPVGQGQPIRAIIERGQNQVDTTVRPGLADQTVALPQLADNTGPVGLDLVFLLDATGSMGDEIDKIKATVDGIAARIGQLPGSSPPRLGLVAYRDHGDEYVTRSWDFTADIAQFSANLENVAAGGGGDTPEAVSTGLHDAIHLPGWTAPESGRHLRMIVLVGDAPPHLDYQDSDYRTLLGEAVQQGIKIFPIGASGLDPQGEYIFRQFAEVTQGQFVFLTYANGASGAPGNATDNHVPEFTVQHLDSLIVQLVAHEIANQTGDPSLSSAPPAATVMAATVAPVTAPPAPVPANPLVLPNPLVLVAQGIFVVALMGLMAVSLLIHFVLQYGLWLILIGLGIAGVVYFQGRTARRQRQAARRSGYAAFVAPAPVAGRTVAAPTQRDTAPLPVLPTDGQAARR